MRAARPEADGRRRAAAHQSCLANVFAPRQIDVRRSPRGAIVPVTSSVGLIIAAGDGPAFTGKFVPLFTMYVARVARVRG